MVRTCERSLLNFTQFHQISPTKGDCGGDGFGSTCLPHSRYLRVSQMLIQTCFFSLPLAAVLEGTPTKYEQPPKERVVKYWNKLPASVVTAPSVKTCKKRLENRRLSPSSPLTELSFHQSSNLPPPQLHATH